MIARTGYFPSKEIPIYLTMKSIPQRVDTEFDFYYENQLPFTNFTEQFGISDCRQRNFISPGSYWINALNEMFTTNLH